MNCDLQMLLIACRKRQHHITETYENENADQV